LEIFCFSQVEYSSRPDGPSLYYECKQAWNQTEQTEQRVRSGSARWLACSVRLARWRDPVARARLGSAEQPNRLLGLGSAEPNRAARLLALGGVRAAEC